MPSFQINDGAGGATRLPMLAREIYVFALRPFMDFATGVVGEAAHEKRLGNWGHRLVTV